MVCVTCVVIPFVLWVFQKFLQPFLAKFLPWFQKKSVDNPTDQSKIDETATKAKPEQNGIHSLNGDLTSKGPVVDTGGSKKDN